MPLVASIVRLIFPIVSLFPREKTNLNKKAFWQSILVLVENDAIMQMAYYGAAKPQSRLFRWRRAVEI